MMRKLLSLTAAAVAALGFLVVPAAASTAVFDKRDYGATRDGTTNDAPAVNAAIVAANVAGGGTVEFPAGTYIAGNSIHMLSNVTLNLDAGSTLLGAASGARRALRDADQRLQQCHVRPPDDRDGY
jgi:polygalacturonase